MGFLVTLKRWFGLSSSSAAPELKTGDKLLVCEDCGNKFVFDAGEQIFFKEKGFTEPKRCPTCRKKVRRRLRRRGGRGGSKQEDNQQPQQKQHSSNNSGGGKRQRNDNHNRSRRHSAIDGDSPYADER